MCGFILEPRSWLLKRTSFFITVTQLYHLGSINYFVVNLVINYRYPTILVFNSVFQPTHPHDLVQDSEFLNFFLLYNLKLQIS